MLVNKNKYTYKNGEYYSNIDHIVINRKASSNIIHSEIIIDNLDMSDHRPIVAKFEFDAERLVEQSNPTTKQFHKFQWKDIKFKDLYAMKITRILNENKNEFNFNGNVEELIDENLNKLIKFQIKAAREAEKEISKERKTVSNKNMTTHQNHQIQAHVASIDRLNQQANISNVFKVYKIKEIKRLKREIRRLQRQMMFDRQKHSALKLDNMFHLNKKKFWQQIKSFKQEKSGSNSKLDINEFASYYSELFSHIDRESNQKHKEIQNEVSKYYNQIKNKSDDLINFSEFEIMDTIKNLKNDKASGVDYVTNEMIKYAMCETLVDILRCIFNNMVKYGHTPNDFNISLVTPIPKKGENKTPSDFRPISVSSSYAQIYESLLLEKSGIKKLIHVNQFGYKQHTSCKHAYFVVNETINYYKNGKSSIH